ncbi:hypothetical protein QJS10_CPB14g00480 [Acorus calamus]|uniref:Uncharacterized protein n=1 Tax=Acorus calamus TaxID=4465 RepID=A0AAV9D861_ACOCL|nr:hypothetical protein QJS10_CPB14g00480 [Acorus calamus]
MEGEDSEQKRETEKKRSRVAEEGMGSLGWLTESTIMPRKQRSIEGVGPSSILDLKAHLYRSQQEAKNLSSSAASQQHFRAKKFTHKGPTNHFSLKNSGVDARAHRDKLELKAINDGSVSYAALEKKAELYEKLARGELSDEEDREKYCVDFFHKSLSDNISDQPKEPDTSPGVSPQNEYESNDTAQQNAKPAGPGQTSVTIDDDERKRFIREIHEEASQARVKASAVKLRREEQAVARREKLKQAYLKKLLEKATTAKTDQQ